MISALTFAPKRSKPAFLESSGLGAANPANKELCCVLTSASRLMEDFLGAPRLKADLLSSFSDSLSLSTTCKVVAFFYPNDRVGSASVFTFCSVFLGASMMKELLFIDC